MIKNQHQYLVTLQRIATFEEALANVEQRKVNGEPMHPLQLQAWREALQSQLDDLHEEVADYEASHPEACVHRENPEFAELDSQTVHA